MRRLILTPTPSPLYCTVTVPRLILSLYPDTSARSALITLHLCLYLYLQGKASTLSLSISLSDALLGSWQL